MSWRSNSQRTGANDAPLAGMRRWGGGNNGGGGGGGGYDQYSQQQQQQYPPSHGGGGGYNNGGPSSYPERGTSSYSGGNSFAPPPPPPGGAGSPVNPNEPRKRKSRWGDENDKIQVAGLPTAISGNVQGKDLENYAIHVRLEEISRKLRSGEGVVPPERERSPSPPPTYDHHGRRTNTREIRYKKKLEDERNRLVDRAIKSDPNYKPPTEYLMAKRMSGRPQEKIYLPAKEFPEIKWIGLILGPRGNSLKNMERDSGAKIVIRGKGSTKEGKGNFGNRSADENDELHCNVTADTQEKVDACVRLINKVIATAASTPDEQNDHKRNQLRELAMLNGTLRDDENQPCQNCGKIGHRKYDCPEERNFTANVICRTCGNMGHMARDCIAHRNKPGGMGGPGGMPGTTPQFDSEYSALMAELGEGPAGGINIHQDPNAPQGGGGMDANGGAGGPQQGGDRPIPPWRNPNNWHPPQPPNQGPGGRGGGGFGGGFSGGSGTYGSGANSAQPYQPQGYGGYAAQAAGYDPTASGGAGGQAAGGYDYAAYYSQAGGQGGQGGYGGQQGYGGYQGVAA